MSKNYPQAGLDNVEPGDVNRIVSSLRELHDMGIPENDDEVERRVNDYFAFCEQSSIRPGIESLCLALHISRTTLFRWNNGNGCSQRRCEIIQSAKAMISSFIEQCMMSGKINPASGIFLAKNWLNYKDTISFEESVPSDPCHRSLPESELPRLDQIKRREISQEKCGILNDSDEYNT